MKSFRTYLQEGVARREHAEGNFHTIKAPNNRTLVFSNNEMVAHVDYIPGATSVVPGDTDKFLLYVNGSYRDSRLKLHRPVFRRAGEFSSIDAALKALKNTLSGLRK